MNKLELFILVCTSSFLVSVETCTYNYECSRSGHPGCCVYRKCKRADYYDSGCSRFLYGVNCISDIECTSGCCIDSICKPDSDSQCIAKKKKCDENLDCESQCCRNKQCQDDNSLCPATTKSKL